MNIPPSFEQEPGKTQLKAMVLAAGFGTRLMPLTKKVPKPMFPVMGRPLLAHTLDHLRSFNFRDVAVNVHHLPDQIIEYFRDGTVFPGNLRFSKEEAILGTAGGIKILQGFLEDGPFVVINSDVISDIDLDAVYAFHREKQSCLTLVVREDESPEQYDPIEIDSNGRVVHFIGASSMNLPPQTTRVMFTGIQIMEPEIFNRIPSGKFCGTTEDVFPEMIDEGLPVYGYRHTGYWADLGTRETYLQVHRDAMDGRIRLKAMPSHEPEGVLLVPPVLIGRDCQIARDVQIGPYTVLGPGCTVKPGAIVEDSVCWTNVTVGSGVTLRHCVAADGAVVEDKREIEHQSLV